VFLSPDVLANFFNQRGHIIVRHAALLEVATHRSEDRIEAFQLDVAVNQMMDVGGNSLTGLGRSLGKAASPARD
jgi:hypothetical protein